MTGSVRPVFTVALYLSLAATAAQPSEASAAGLNDGTDVCAPDYRSPLFEAFLGANSNSSGYTLPALRELFRIQGLREWFLLNQEAEKLGFSVLPPPHRMQVDLSSPHSQGIINGGWLTQQLYNEVSEQLLNIKMIPPESSKLSIMTDYMKSLVALNSRDFLLSRRLAEAALIRSIQFNGIGNAGELIGHYVSAQAAYQQGEMRTALDEARKGLEIIGSNPSRAGLLGNYEVVFLLMQAEILERDLQANVLPPPGRTLESVVDEISSLRSRASEVIDAGHATFGSPYFDAAAALPMFQAAVNQSWANHTALLGTPEQLSLKFSTLAAMTPSGERGSTRAVRMTDGNELLSAIRSCIEAETYSNEAGDFERARQVRQTLLNLLNRRNAELILRDLRRGSEDDDQVDLNDVTGLTGYVGQLVQMGQGALVQGEGVLFSRHLEEFLTPRLIDAGIEAAIRQEEADWEDEEIGARLRPAKPTARAVVKFSLDVLATLSGDPNRQRAARLHSAMEVLTRDRVNALASHIYALAENDDPDEDDITEARLTYRLVGLGAGTLAWMNAKASGDKRLATSIQSDLAAASGRVARELRPGAPATAFEALNSLGDTRRRERNVFVNTANIVSFAAETASFDEDEYGNPDESVVEGPFGERIEARQLGQMAAGFLLMPAAQRAGEYEQVLDIGRPAVAAFEAFLEDLEGPDRAILTSIGGPALAAYSDALSMTGRPEHAASLIDQMLPVPNTFDEEWPNDLRELGSIFFSDDLLDAGVRANASIAKYERAFEIARIRVERSSAFLRTQRLVNDSSLRGELRAPRAPHEQMIALAANAPEPVEIPWDDVLFAFNELRRSEAAEAQILRDAAYQAGFGARQAYEHFVIAQSEFEAISSPASFGWNALMEGADLIDLSNEHWAKARAFYDSREKLLAQLPPAIAKRLEGRLRLQDLQSSLDQGEVILAHTVAQGRLAIMVIPARGQPSLVWSPLPIEEIRSRIGRAEREFRLPERYLDRSRLAAPNGQNLQILYDALIRPVQELVNQSDHVIWSPDAEVASAPILAFQSNDGFTAPDGTRTVYFGLGKALSLAPSIASFGLARQTGRQPASGTLAIGDISYSAAGERGFSSSLRPATGPIPPTKNARSTIEAFVEATGGKSITGSMATRNSIAQLPRQHLSMLMFYAHGSDARNLRPAALLLQGETPSNISEYTPADVLISPLSADLVLLAACNTGAGHTETGSPYSGLVMSFLARGSTAVLSAQQQVDEQATSQIITGLALGIGKTSRSAAEVLRQEIFRLSSEEQFSNPVLWSQFLWVGDGAR